jgi:hypothetical protein
MFSEIERGQQAGTEAESITTGLSILLLAKMVRVDIL